MAAIALLLVASTGLAWGIKFDVTPPSEIERTLAELKAAPLVGMAMADNPDAAGRIRAALAEDLSNPVAPGVPSRTSYAVGELSRDHIRPMLAAADDQSVVDVLAARYSLALHMRDTNVALCRNFAMNTVLHIEALDSAGQELFRAFVVATEKAYRSGRAAAGKPGAIASASEMATMLRETGFTQQDLEDLNRFATLSALRACEIDLKIDGAPPGLPAAQQAPFARYVLTH